MRLYFLLFFILFINNCFTQNKFSKDDLIARSTPITITTSSDFRDLEFIKNKIDTSLPLFLGESSHYISDYNRLRVKMIKYLHEQLNYNVIAFEAPFSNLQYINVNRDVLSPEKMVKKGMYYCWKTDDLLELMNYLKSHPKLKIVGIDCQDYSIDSLTINSYYSKIEKQNSELAKEYKKITSDFLQLMKANPFEYKEQNKIDNQQLIAKVDILIQSLINIKMNDFELQFQLSNFKNSCIEFNMFKPDFSKACRFRDSMMAENYLSLTKTLFPNEKVIVWGHNAHLSKKSLDVKYPKSMGEFLNEKMKFNVIGLYAYGGNYKYVYMNETNMIKPSKKYLEYYLQQNNFELSYIDFENIPSDSWLNRTYKTLDTGHGVMHVTPSLSFDAVILFKHVEASKLLDFK